MDRAFDSANGEAEWTLADLVRDPLIGLVMKSDGVDRRSIELLFEGLARDRRERLGKRRTGSRASAGGCAPAGSGTTTPMPPAK